MRNDPIVFYRGLRLGDYAIRLPAITPEHDPAEPIGGIGANSGRINQTIGAASRSRIRVEHALHQELAESDREFIARRVQYSEALRSVVGRDNGFIRSGALGVVNDADNDLTTLSLAAGPGSGIDLDLTKDIGVVEGDAIYICDETDPAAHAEILIAESGTSGMTVVASPAVAWSSGVTVARLVFYAEEAFPQALPTIEMVSKGSTRASRDLEVEFLVVGEVKA